jgi:hypothetical protein
MLNLLRGPDFNMACSLACSFKQTEGVAHEEDSRGTVSGRPGIPGSGPTYQKLWTQCVLANPLHGCPLFVNLLFTS